MSQKNVSRKQAKKSRLIREVVKERHTSHWDLDYISRDELERLMCGESPVERETGQHNDQPRPSAGTAGRHTRNRD